MFCSREYQHTTILLQQNEKSTLNQNYIWDALEINWKEVSVTFNDNKINLPRIVTIKLRDKIKIICFMKKEQLLCHIMFKQGIHEKVEFLFNKINFYW